MASSATRTPTTTTARVANEMSGAERQAAFEFVRGPTAHTLANALIRPTPTQGKEEDMRLRVHTLFRDDEGGGGDEDDDVYVMAPGFIFDVPLRRDVVHTVVRWQLAKRRSSVNAHTKTQGTVHGTTRKPHKQKGTGNARQGSRRGPHFRGGGIAFGPTNQKVHEIGCNRKIRRKALTIALSARLAEGRLFIVDGFRPEDPENEMDAGKTKVMLRSVARLIGEPDQTNPSCLIVHGSSKSGGVAVDIEDDDDDEEEEEEDDDDEGKASVVAVNRDSDAFDIKAVDEDVDVEKIKRSSSNLRSVDIIDQIGLNVYSILRRKYLVISKAALSDLVLRLSIPMRPRERYLLALELERHERERAILKSDDNVHSSLEDMQQEAQQQ